MQKLKYILHSIAVCAIVALATACSSDIELNNKLAGKTGTVTLTAYQPGCENDTRVGFGEDGKAYWHAGDKIGVVCDSDTYLKPFVLSAGAGTAKASFKGNVTGSIGKYVLYPYNDGDFIWEDKGEYEDVFDYDFEMWLPNKFTYDSVDTTFFPKDKCGNNFMMPMLGVVSDDNVVTFKYIGGVICLLIDNMPSSSGTITVEDSTYVLEMAHYGKFSDEELKAKNTVSSSFQGIPTFKFSNAEKGKPGVFYLPVPTGSYKLTITIEGGDLYCKTKASCTVERGQLQPVNVKTDYNGHYKYINGHIFIDLGLPSGLLWAKEDVTDKHGYSYFQWGETKGRYEAQFNEVLNKYYKHVSDHDEHFTKYNYKDGKTVLDKEDDAAYVNWGTPCRMPTKEDFEELQNNCVLSGHKFTSKINGAYIILPKWLFYTKNGHRSGFTYWTSTLSSWSIYYGCAFDDSEYSNMGKWGRGCGLPIRAVAPGDGSEPSVDDNSQVKDAIWENLDK